MTRNGAPLLLVAAAAWLVVACAAQADDAVESLALSEDSSIDSEADDLGATRRLELARLVGEHLERPEPANVDADRDGDGIADALEEELLRRYRPVYRFTRAAGKDESYRPADPVDEIRHGHLAMMNADGAGATGSIEGCGRPEDLASDPASIFACRPEASLLTARQKTNVCIGIDRARHSGVTLDEAKDHATGLYGHVAESTVGEHAAYKIEYWQFFAFNNQDIRFLGLGSYGDHDGDWTSVQLWYDRVERRLAKIVYLIHGMAIHFAVPAGAPWCRDCTLTVHGEHFAPDVGNFFDEHARAQYDDNAAEFFVDEHGYKHVVAYVERGGHEFWPGRWGYADIVAGPLTIHLNSHAGDGTSFLVPDSLERPLNLGEVDRPLSAEARTVLSFNGYWGCTNDKDLGGPLRRSPIGPALHCSWAWPTGAPIEGCEE